MENSEWFLVQNESTGKWHITEKIDRDSSCYSLCGQQDYLDNYSNKLELNRNTLRHPLSEKLACKTCYKNLMRPTHPNLKRFWPKLLVSYEKLKNLYRENGINIVVRSLIKG